MGACAYLKGIMVEGHSVHRIAAAHARRLVGRRYKVRMIAACAIAGFPDACEPMRVRALCMYINQRVAKFVCVAVGAQGQ